MIITNDNLFTIISLGFLFLVVFELFFSTSFGDFAKKISEDYVVSLIIFVIAHFVIKFW
jgi:hypothetical protein